MKVKYVSKKVEAEGVYSFFFKPEGHFRQIAGQFIELTLPHAAADDRGQKRWFTLSNAPGANRLSVTTKFYDRPSTFKQTLLDLSLGTSLHMTSPMGDFVLPKNPSAKVLFVALGIGCTPYHSIISEITSKRHKRDIKLLYAETNENKVAFKSTFEVLGENFIIKLQDKLRAGDIIAEITSKNQHIYISGPEPAIEKLDADLKVAGINPNLIHTDFFPGYIS